MMVKVGARPLYYPDMTNLSNNNKMPILVGTVVVAVLVGLALYAVSIKGPPEVRMGASSEFDTSVLPYEGKADAPVSVVIVEDFKCPVCRAFEADVMPKLRDKYVKTGQVKVHSLIWPFLSEVVHLPEDDSQNAAQAAQCVFQQKGNEGFESYKTILFRAQGDESQVWATKERLKELAVNVEGLDMEAFGTCLDTDATREQVVANEAQVTRAKVNHTPAVFVNGTEVVQMGGLERLGEDIGKAIEAAAGGTKSP